MSHFRHCHPNFTLTFSNTNDLIPVRCKDLKNAIYESTGIALQQQQLVINGQISLCDDDLLNLFDIRRHTNCPSPCSKHVNEVVLVPLITFHRGNISIAAQREVSASIKPYINSVFPPDGSENVSRNVLIQVKFQTLRLNVAATPDGFIDLEESSAHLLENKINLDSFILDSKNPCNSDTRCWVSTTDMEGTLGINEACKRGFVRWNCQKSSQWLNKKIFLLEVDKSQSEILSSRYEYRPWGGRNGKYHGGDRYSWQRYTGCEPVPVTIKTFDCEEGGNGSVTISPSIPLKSNVRYVIVVRNGLIISSRFVASNGKVDKRSVTTPTMYYSTEEDALFFFTTEPRRQREKVQNNSCKESFSLDSSDDDIGDDDAHDKVLIKGNQSTAVCYGSGSAGGEPPLCSIS